MKQNRLGRLLKWNIKDTGLYCMAGLEGSKWTCGR